MYYLVYEFIIIIIINKSIKDYVLSPTAHLWVLIEPFPLLLNNSPPSLIIDWYLDRKLTRALHFVPIIEDQYQCLIGRLDLTKKKVGNQKD